MDILEILKSSKEDIYLEDLAFFETELATGDYAESYIAECKEQIRLVRNWLRGENEVFTGRLEEENLPKKQPKAALIMGLHDIAPETVDPAVAAMTPEDVIFSDIRSMRESDSYRSKFKEYVQDCAKIDAAFVDRQYAFFLPWELDAIASVKQLGEEFLEKYFGMLDKDKIARYQVFSESFFMKHYSQLDATLVLTKGKNEWRKKEKRSKQLDVFLRLKGVKI